MQKRLSRFHKEQQKNRTNVSLELRKTFSQMTEVPRESTQHSFREGSRQYKQQEKQAQRQQVYNMVDMKRVAVDQLDKAQGRHSVQHKA